MALQEAGSSLEQAVRVHYIYADKADFEPCWPVLSKYLGRARPAATVFMAELLEQAWQATPDDLGLLRLLAESDITLPDRGNRLPAVSRDLWR